MKRTHRVVAPVTLAVALLAGCGGDASDKPDESGMTGTGYSFKAPAGWSDLTARSKAIQPGVDSAAGETAPDDGFADNVNVGFDSAPGKDLDDLETSVPGQLKSMVKEIEILPRVDIDGIEAIHHRGQATQGARKFFLEQFATIDDDGKIAIITFSFSTNAPEAERDETVDSVLASWDWAA